MEENDVFGRIARKFKEHDPATLDPAIFTEEEWAIMAEIYNERAVKYANLKSVMDWVHLTNYLPNGVLSSTEKVEMIRLVLSRVPTDWR